MQWRFQSEAAADMHDNYNNNNSGGGQLLTSDNFALRRHTFLKLRRDRSAKCKFGTLSLCYCVCKRKLVVATIIDSDYY